MRMTIRITLPFALCASLLACGTTPRPPTLSDSGIGPDGLAGFDVPPLSDTGVFTDISTGSDASDAPADISSTVDASDSGAATDISVVGDTPGASDGGSSDGSSVDATLDGTTSDVPVVFFDLGTDSGPPPRNGPQLLSPLSGSSSASLLPTFQWVAYAGATGYRIELSTTRAFTAIEASFNATTTSFTPAAARPPGHSFWRVIPQLAGGSAGPTSLTWEIDLGLAPGDLNGDGFADAVIGTAARNSGAGAVDIYEGSATPPALPSVSLAGASGEAFGTAISNNGDVNADGYADLLIGAPSNSHEGTGAGRVYLFLGGPHFATTPALTIDGPAAGAAFGSSVAILGDVDGDGFDDFAVGAPLFATTGPATGKVWVYFGAATPSATRFETLAYATPGDQFGRSVAAASDVDGDGLDDILIGAPHNVTPGTQGGQAYIYLGGLVFNFVPDVVIPGSSANVQAGTSVAGLGDFNRDGYADVAVGAPFNSTGAPAGQVYLLYGSYPPHTTVDLHLTGENGEQFGHTVAGIGDVNNDGYTDLAVGAPFNGDIGLNAGHVYFFPGASEPTSVPGETLANSVGGDQYGTALSGVGDFNHDGIADFLVGAPYAPSSGAAGPGTGYLYLGNMGVPGTPAAMWRGMNADQYGGAVALRWFIVRRSPWPG